MKGLEILIYTKLVGILYRLLCKKKRIGKCYGIIAYYVSFEVHFVRRSILLSLRKN